MEAGTTIIGMRQALRVAAPQIANKPQGDCWAAKGEQVQVEVHGVPLWLPQGSVHASEDGAFWVCRKRPPKENAVLTAEQVRCVFYAIGF